MRNTIQLDLFPLILFLEFQLVYNFLHTDGLDLKKVLFAQFAKVRAQTMMDMTKHDCVNGEK